MKVRGTGARDKWRLQEGSDRPGNGLAAELKGNSKNRGNTSRGDAESIKRYGLRSLKNCDANLSVPLFGRSNRHVAAAGPAGNYAEPVEKPRKPFTMLAARLRRVNAT